MDVQVSMPPPPPPPPPPPFFAETVTSQLTVPPPPPPPPLPQSTITTTTAVAPPTTTASVAGPSTQERIWLHPWTAAEMRQNASQWSLAGDAGLLLYLENFSDKLVQRADAIQQHLSQTVNAVKSTHTRVQNCLNEFTSLANTQFIENRVYDEDETANVTPSKKDEPSTDKANVNNIEAQEKVLQRYVEAVQYGLAILETHFERVDTKLDVAQNGSSSYVDDEEDEGVPIEPILEPKDPYIYRPLPFLIGSSEFMQDDYIGLGDLLNPSDGEELIGAEIRRVDPYSSLSSSDVEEENKDDDEFTAYPSSVPIVPAGASRPDAVNQLRQPTTVLTDSENEDDPFGIGSRRPFDNFASTKPVANDNSDKKQTIPPKSNQPNFGSGSDDDDEDDDPLFNPVKKPPQISKNRNDDIFDKQSLTSKESDESEEPKQETDTPAPVSGKKVMSALEEAVQRRFEKMQKLESQQANEESDVKIPTKTSNETISPLGNKTTIKPTPEPLSSATISSLVPKQIITAEKNPPLSIFGQHAAPKDDDDDDDDDFFKDAPKLPPVTSVLPALIPKIETKPSPSLTTVGKKSTTFDFDSDNDDDDDPFQPKKKDISSTIQKKSNNSDLKPPTTVINKTKPIIPDDESDDDLFPTSKSNKPQLPPAKIQTSDDDDFSFTSKPSIQKPPTVSTISSPAPVIPQVVTKPISAVEEDSDDEIFGISKRKVPLTVTQNIVTPVKPKDEDDVIRISTTESNKKKTEIPKLPSPTKSSDDDELFGGPTTKLKIPSAQLPNATAAKSNKDDELFPVKPIHVELPPPVSLIPLPQPPPVTTIVDEDPLFAISKPIETISSSRPTAESSKILSGTGVQSEKKTFSDSEDEALLPKRQLNTAALKEGEKPNVKGLAGLLNINPTAHKPGARPKPSSTIEQSPKTSVNDEQPSVSVVKKPLKDDSDSDDDLFPTKKTVPSAVPVVEQKEKTRDIKENGGLSSVKALAAGLKINPMMQMAGAQPKPISKQGEESDFTTPTTSTDASKEESTADKTVSDMLKDRPKRPVGTRTLPSRKPRSTGAAAITTSTNENDDLFALSSSTNTAASSSSSPPPPPPPTTTVPIIPPTMPVTGLPDNIATIAAKSNKHNNSKEKKNISLFDSDDSDIDELLFGSSKKNKSTAVTKPTTTVTKPATTTSSAASKVTTKSSILSLDDDDDFLSKRPIKKNTKPVDNDDIFADVNNKSQSGNKAKKDWSIMNKSGTNDTDDIFNDLKSKSSNTSKPKSTNVNNKPAKDLDDIFDDPLNVTSKR